MHIRSSSILVRRFVNTICQLNHKSLFRWTNWIFRRSCPSFQSIWELHLQRSMIDGQISFNFNSTFPAKCSTLQSQYVHFFVGVLSSIIQWALHLSQVVLSVYITFFLSLSILELFEKPCDLELHQFHRCFDTFFSVINSKFSKLQKNSCQKKSMCKHNSSLSRWKM